MAYPLRLHDQPVLALKLLAALSQGTMRFHFWEPKMDGLCWFHNKHTESQLRTPMKTKAMLGFDVKFASKCGFDTRLRTNMKHCIISYSFKT